MNISHGFILRKMVEQMQQHVIEKGHPVIVNNQATIEVLNYGFKLFYEAPIDLEDIRKSMLDYYNENDINLSTLEELEHAEYSIIATELYNKFELFKQDKNSRQVLFTDDCCISMIHFLIRGGTIYCYMHLRSSDCVNKLFSDLYLVHKIISKLQEFEKINSVRFDFVANSLHKVVYSI
jgi:thymidylate synthase